MNINKKQIKQLKNKKTLEKLFEYCKEDMYDSIETKDEINIAIIKIAEEFYEMLTEEQKIKFEKLCDLNINRSYNIHKNIFIWAYSLAMKTLIESIE